MRKLVLCLALAAPLAASANGYDVPNLSPRDLSMVAAATASQQDAGAVYGLPAALARLPEGLSLNVAGTLIDIRSEWNGVGVYDGQSSRTKFHPAFPPVLFASYTTKLLDHGFGFGVGFNVVGGANVFWPDDWAGRSRIVTVDRRVFGMYATAGTELVKQLRVGGGLVYYRTTEELKQGVDPTPGTATLSTGGGALAWDLSLEATPFDDVPLTLAVDYKHQGVQKLEGDVHFDVPATLAPQLQDQTATHVLTYPNVLNVGAAYRFTPTLLVNAVFTFNRYAVYNQDLFQGSKPFPGQIVVPRNYTNGQVYRLGVEWAATPALTLRGGVLRDITGMPKSTGPNGELLSETYSPTLPDSNTWAGALGVGYKFAENLAVNGAVFYAHMDEVRSTGTQAFPGRYNSHALIYSLGVAYHWGPGESFGQLRPVNAE